MAAPKAQDERPPVRDWRAVVVFDGKGGVRRLTEAEEDQPYVVPAKGFVLVAGNSRSPDFKVWMRNELGDLNAETLIVPVTRTRCVVLEDKAIVVLRVARAGADPEDLGRQLMSLFIEKGRVIISSELNLPEFLGIANWQQSHHAPVSPADLVSRLGLRAADRLEPLVERIGDSLDAIEEGLMIDSTGEIRAPLARLRRSLISFRRLLWPQRDVLNTLEIEDLSFFTPRDRLRLREASSRTARLGDELQALSERAVLVHEQLLDTRAEQMNRTMLVLTSVTVIFMPLTVISGALGMNVDGIPFAHEPWAFAGVCLGLVVVAASLVVWMKAHKWL